MAWPRVSAHLPLYDPSKSSLAYGNRAIPKLNRELKSQDLAVRQQALLLLNDVMHRRENLASALKEGIAETLQGLLRDEDSHVRQRSASVLAIVAQHALGRKSFLELGMITSLSKLFSDSELAVRLSAHVAVEMCSRTREGAQGVVDADLVPLCVGKLMEEESTELKGYILDTLHWCFQVDTAQGLKCGTISSSTSHLSHHSPIIRSRSARILYDLTVPYSGKEEASRNSKCIESLVKLLADESTFVRSQTIAALMSIAVITKGKYAVLNAGALDGLILLLKDKSSEVRLNALKALTLLAETPAGKKELQSILPQLEEMSTEGGGRRATQVESKAIKTTQRVITWLP